MLPVLGVARAPAGGKAARRMIRRGIPLLFLTVVAPLGFEVRAGLPAEREAVADDMAQLRKLVGKSERWRGESRRFHASVSNLLKDGVLTSGDMTRLYGCAEEYVRLRRRWQALLDCQGEESWDRMGPSLAFSPLNRLQSKLALAAALAQHDDYLIGVHPWFKDDKSRRLLKSDHPAVEGELDSAVRHFLSPIVRLRMARAVVWHRAEGAQVPDRTPDEVYLDELIRRSPGYSFFAKNLGERVLEEWKTGGHAAVTFVTDHLANFGELAESSVSRAVGNTVGLVEFRRGWLDTLPPAERWRVEGGLKPLDLLLEKTPFRLTDGTIPGHYGHVALWVGTEVELKAMGVWDDPLVRPHHERIRVGAGVVEALRSGVEINSFAHFLNIDDLLVLRPAPMSESERRAGVLRAFAQLGKAYDFNFDVESDRRIVCSELAFIVFPSVSWPTSSVLGRRSITPDQVAGQGEAGGSFRPVLMYHDGMPVRDKLGESLARLLKDDEVGFRRLHPDFSGRSDAR